MSILKLTGLSDRILAEDDNYSLYECKIDFDKVNKIISRERENSISILTEMLNSVKRG